MIVEMRVYHCLPGRLPALQDRFRNTTLPFFEKYGIEPIGFWTTLVGESNQSLTYMLKWASLADRESRWAAFQSDQDWQTKRAASEAQTPIVARIENSFLTPTDFSPLR